MYFKLFLGSYNSMNKNGDFSKNKREGWGEQ